MWSKEEGLKFIFEFYFQILRCKIVLLIAEKRVFSREKGGKEGIIINGFQGFEFGVVVKDLCGCFDGQLEVWIRGCQIYFNSFMYMVNVNNYQFFFIGFVSIVV